MGIREVDYMCFQPDFDNAVVHISSGITRRSPEGSKGALQCLLMSAASDIMQMIVI